MSSFWNRVKEREDKGTTPLNSDSDISNNGTENESSFWDRVKEREDKGITIKIGSNLTGEQVDNWYSGVDMIAKSGYAYVTADGYRSRNTVVPTSIDGYLDQADDVAVWLRANKDNIENFDDVLQNHYNMVNYLRSLQSSVKSIGNYYSRWDDEEDYFKTSADTRADRQKRYADNQARIEALQEESKQAGIGLSRQREITAEIDKLQAENNQYKRGEGGWISKDLDDYYTYTEAEDFKAGSANRNIVNPTREDLDYYDVMMDNSTWYWDANGVRRDAFGNEIDMTNVDANNRIVHPMANDERYMVKDPLGMYLSATDDEVSEACGIPDHLAGTWATILDVGEYFHWDNLTSTETDIYYYLLNTQGTDAANKFLVDMQVELAKRETFEYNRKWTAQYENTNWLGKLFMNIESIPTNVLGGALGYIDDLGHQLDGQDINPYNNAHRGMHYTNTVRGMTAAELDESGFVFLPGILDYSLGDIYQTVMSRGDSLFATAIFGGAGTILLGMGAAQSEGYRLYQAGASAEQIALGAAAAGAAECAFEYLSFDKLVKLKDAKTGLQWVTNALIQGGLEASEEGFTEVANMLTNAIIMRSESDWANMLEENGGDKWKTFLGAVQQTAQSMFGGFLGGFGAGFTQGGKTYINTQKNNIKTGRTIIGAGGVDAMKSLANEVAGVSPKGLSKSITRQAGNVTGETATGKGLGKVVAGAKNLNNAQRVGKLYDTVKTSLDTQSHADIVKTLTRGENAFSQKEASKIAGALIAQANGLELTKEQSRLLDSVKDNPKVQRALDAVLNNEQSTVGQRNRQLGRFQESVNRGLVRAIEATGIESLPLSGEQSAKGEENAHTAQSAATVTNTPMGADLASVSTADGGQTGTQPGSMEQQSGEMPATGQQGEPVPKSARDILLQAEAVLGAENLTEKERSALNTYRQQADQLEALKQQRDELQRQLQTGTQPDIPTARGIQNQIKALDGEIAKAEAALTAAQSSKTLSRVMRKTRTILENNASNPIRSGNFQLDNSGEYDIIPSEGTKPFSDCYEAEYAGREIITDGSHIQNGKLKPNAVYRAGENGYLYETDADGKIVRAVTDDLQKKKHKGRLRNALNTLGKLAEDHAGHLFGDRFGGSPQLDNLVSQAKLVNLSIYKKIENQWAKAIKQGKNVRVSISLHYDGGVRPVAFDVAYYVGNVRKHAIISNVNETQSSSTNGSRREK